MAYFIDLFSPETYEAFGASDRSVSGFRIRHHSIARRLKAGDKLICYLTRVSRWCGVLEVMDGPFVDTTPIFMPEEDPFVVRFHVRTVAWLSIPHALPIYDDRIWQALTFTRPHERGSSGWTGKIRGSLVQLDEHDGQFLEEALVAQMHRPTIYHLEESDQKKLAAHTVRRTDKVITVSVPDEDVSDGAEPDEPQVVVTRESLCIQALLADIGTRMNMSIWVPRNDRGGVLAEWKADHRPIVERLPLNYDEVTLKTIENIDVIWLRGRSIVRAFEVEHTTAVYSGILRMADLLALQPNMDIKLHIVAPITKRDKVFQEIRRPVFALLDRKPLAERCSYVSYDAVRELARQPLLSHLMDSVLDEYAEEAE